MPCMKTPYESYEKANGARLRIAQGDRRNHHTGKRKRPAYEARAYKCDVCWQESGITVWHLASTSGQLWRN